jgi:hypothetical protein
MRIKENNIKIWNGIHKGVDFEIRNFQDFRGNECWNYYLIVNISRIPENYNPNSFWLKGKKVGKFINYDYMSHEIISKIYFHGGCTWYSKERGFDGDDKIIKIGCDYQHIWDEGEKYNLEDVLSDVLKSIESFLTFIPNYKYKCCGNGKLYDLKDGVLIDDVFHSFEYWSKYDWFKEKYMQVTN